MWIDRLTSLASSVNQPSGSATNAKISLHNKKIRQWSFLQNYFLLKMLKKAATF